MGKETGPATGARRLHLDMAGYGRSAPASGNDEIGPRRKDTSGAARVQPGQATSQQNVWQDGQCRIPDFLDFITAAECVGDTEALVCRALALIGQHPGKRLGFLIGFISLMWYYLGHVSSFRRLQQSATPRGRHRDKARKSHEFNF